MKISQWAFVFAFCILLLFPLTTFSIKMENRTTVEKETSLDNWFPIVLEMEGVFSDRNLKEDPGGKTKFGITERTLQIAIDNNFVPEIEIENISTVHSRMIADSLFFKNKKLQYIKHESIALWIFETYWGGDAYNYCKSQLQKNLWNKKNCLEVDGVIGFETIVTINQLSILEAEKLCTELFLIRLDYLKSLENYESNKNGWQKRLRAWFGFSIKKK